MTSIINWVDVGFAVLALLLLLWDRRLAPRVRVFALSMKALGPTCEDQLISQLRKSPLIRELLLSYLVLLLYLAIFVQFKSNMSSFFYTVMMGIGLITFFGPIFWTAMTDPSPRAEKT